MPEWNSVPSPMFWMRCSSSTNGAMPNHCAPSLPIAVRPTMSPTRSGSIISTMLWQPMPAPTSAPSGTLVDVLCGQPRAEVRRAADATAGSAAAAPAVRARGASAEPRGAAACASGAAIVSASSVPVNGNSGVLVGCRACRPRRALGLRVQRVLHQPLEVRGLLLDDDHLARARRRTRGPGAMSSGTGIAELEQADAGGAQVVVGARGRAGAAPRASRWYVCPDGDDADPVVGRRARRRC